MTTPTTTTTTTTNSLPSSRPRKRKVFQPQVGVVDFHHARGPEVEFWVSEQGSRLYAKNDWSLLPFMALSDGAHARTEEYSWFTLLDRDDGADGRDGADARDDGSGDGADVKDSDTDVPARTRTRAKPGDRTLFGIACTRQIRSESLKNRSADVTRSSVQKSVVVVVGDARGLGELKTRLGFVTETWFNQRDFSDIDILKAFQDSLIKVVNDQGVEEDDDEPNGEVYFGLSLREVIHDLRHQTLVLVKALILQRRILFFGSSCEQVCLLQFALVSLIPSLMAHLEDCAHPDLESEAEPTLSTAAPDASSRTELLSFVGQPLRIFGKGSVFMPYAPLQHLDLLADYDTKSYVVGSTNSLLLQQKEHYADLLVNMDDQPTSISILSPSLRQALQLTAADRRWIDALTEKVMDTWDERNPSQPKGMGYQGSEEAIRLAFEEYILSLCSCMAYQQYREAVDGEERKESSSSSSFDKISRAVKARRSAENEAVRAQFDESALPGAEEGERGEEGGEEESAPPKTPPQRPDQHDANRHAQDQDQPNEFPVLNPNANANASANPNIRLINSPPKKIDLVAQTYDPADNTADFSGPFLSAWQESGNCQRFLAHVKDKRIFDVVEPRHPTAGGFNIDDLNRRLAQNLGDLRKQYHVDEKYALARGRAGEALQASRERWGRWWNDLDEHRRQRQRRRRSSPNKENRAENSAGASASASDGGGDADGCGRFDINRQDDDDEGTGTGTGTGAGLGIDLAEQPANGPTQTPAGQSEQQRQAVVDTAAVQRAARESAAKASAYLSSWGTWARQKGSEWQQQQQQ